MTKQKLLIGKQIDCSSHTIEAEKIRLAYRALSQRNPYLESHIFENSAQAFLPPYLCGNLINLPKIYQRLDLNIKNILLSRESLISHQAIMVGETVVIKTYLKDAYEQQATSNPIGFIILDSIGQKNNEYIFYSERIMAVRGGFERGSKI